MATEAEKQEVNLAAGDLEDQHWAQAREALQHKLESEGEDSKVILDYLKDNVTAENALATCKNVKERAEREYSKGYVLTIKGKQFINKEKLGKILQRVEGFVRAGDLAVKAGPETVGLVWSAFRMLLQVTQVLGEGPRLSLFSSTAHKCFHLDLQY